MLADSSDVKTGTCVTKCVYVCLKKLLQLAVKSLRDPGVQLSRAIDRLVGEDGMDKRCAPLKSQKCEKRQVWEQWLKHKGRRFPSTDGFKLLKHLLEGFTGYPKTFDFSPFL